jgi:hypothetical protein
MKIGQCSAKQENTINRWMSRIYMGLHTAKAPKHSSNRIMDSMDHPGTRLAY